MSQSPQGPQQERASRLYYRTEQDAVDDERVYQGQGHAIVRYRILGLNRPVRHQIHLDQESPRYLIVDIDDAEGQAWLNTQSGEALPYTWTFRLRHGLRFVYELPSGYAWEGQYNYRVTEGVVVFDARQFWVALPPLSKPNGVSQWIPACDPLIRPMATAPEWMLVHCVREDADAEI